MSEIRCPSCSDIFRVPESGVPPHALIHCPWCGDAFTAERLLAALPPAARITDESGAELAVAAGEYSAKSPLTDSPDTAAIEVDGASDESAASDYDWSALTEDADESASIADEPLSAEEEPFAAQPRSWSELSAAGDEEDDYEEEEGSEEHPFHFRGSVEPRPLHDYSDDEFVDEERSFIPRLRSSSGNGSSLKSVVGVIMGGLLSIPLAAFILALLGRPLDLGFWPLDGKAFTGAGETRSAAPPSPPIERRSVPANNRQGRSLGDDLTRNEPLTDDRRPAAVQSSAGDHDRIASLPDRRERDDTEGLPETYPQTDEVTDSASEAISESEPTVTPETEDADDSAELPLAPVDSASEADEALEAVVIDAESQGTESLEPAPSDERATADESSIAAGESDGLSEFTAANGAVSTVSDDDLIGAADVEPLPATSTEEPFDAVAVADEIIQTITATKPSKVADSGGRSEPFEGDDSANPAEPQDPPTPRFSSPELQQAVLAAEDALGEFESDESLAADVRKQHLTRLFISLAAVGELTEEEDVPEVQALVYRTIDSGLLSELEKAGPRWASLSRRTNDGLLAVGSLRQDGERWLLDWNGPEPLVVEGVEPDQATELPLVLLGKLPATETPSVRATLLTPVGR